MFKGAIIDLHTVTTGHVYAKSHYQWHCVDIKSTSEIKTCKKLRFTNGETVFFSRISCNLKNCWSLKSDENMYKAGSWKPNGDCTASHSAPVTLFHSL